MWSGPLLLYVQYLSFWNLLWLVHQVPGSKMRQERIFFQWSWCWVTGCLLQVTLLRSELCTSLVTLWRVTGRLHSVFPVLLLTFSDRLLLLPWDEFQNNNLVFFSFFSKMSTSKTCYFCLRVMPSIKSHCFLPLRHVLLNIFFRLLHVTLRNPGKAVNFRFIFVVIMKFSCLFLPEILCLLKTLIVPTLK